MKILAVYSARQFFDLLPRLKTGMRSNYVSDTEDFSDVAGHSPETQTVGYTTQSRKFIFLIYQSMVCTI